VNRFRPRAGKPILKTASRTSRLGNHLDFSVQCHQQQLDPEGGILRLDHLAQLLQLRRVYRGFLRGILGKVLPQNDLIGAAIPVI
jgi:hypothetical protein